MSKKEAFQHIITDYEERRSTATLIEVYWKDGSKAGIGNPEVIQKVIDCVISEARKQLAELG